MACDHRRAQITDTSIGATPGTGWGYRHIKYKHGYGPDDERDTVLALSDSAPSQSPPGSTSWKFGTPAQT